jgi:L-malate glycosyltransferase
VRESGIVSHQDEPFKILLFADTTSPNVQRWMEGLTGCGAIVHARSLHTSTPTQTLKVMLPVSGKLRYFAAVPDARKQIAELKPDIVMAYFVTGYGTIGALSGFRPLVQITSGYDVLKSQYQPGMRQLVQFNLSRADLITSWSPHMTQAMRAMGIPDKKIVTRPRGIPLDVFGAVRASEPRTDIPFRIISTRSLLPEYKLDVLIRAVDVLIHQYSLDCRLTIVGRGPLSEPLIALAERLGLLEAVDFWAMYRIASLPQFWRSMIAMCHYPISMGFQLRYLKGWLSDWFPLCLII